MAQNPLSGIRHHSHKLARIRSRKQQTAPVETLLELGVALSITVLRI
jgi:hypothetical protein